MTNFDADPATWPSVALGPVATGVRVPVSAGGGAAGLPEGWTEGATGVLVKQANGWALELTRTGDAEDGPGVQVARRSYAGRWDDWAFDMLGTVPATPLAGKSLLNTQAFLTGGTCYVQVYRLGNLVVVSICLTVTASSIGARIVLLQPAPKPSRANFAAAAIWGSNGLPIEELRYSEPQLYFEVFSGGRHPSGLATCNCVYVAAE